MRLPILACTVAFAATASARSEEDRFISPTAFMMTGKKPIGDAKPGKPVPAYATSSRIAALDGGGALVIDADSGWLIRADMAGAPLDHVAIGLDAGTLAYDPIGKRAYVADRRGDRVAVVTVGEKLELYASWSTPAEPFGIALAPDRKTLLASTIADRTLVAFDTATGKERWRAALDAEPRGVAIAADGAHAAVATLDAPSVDEVELAGKHHLTRLAIESATFNGDDARGAFAVTYLGEHEIATALQFELPAASSSNEGHYGGSSVPPLSHGIAFVDDRGNAVTAITNVNEPRAVAWDAAHDALYVVGMASDAIVKVDHSSQIDPALAVSGSLGTRCGADGLAIAGDSVLVWCSFPRTVVRVTAQKTVIAKAGPELVASNLDAKQHLGMVMFHTADTNVSAMGGLSCGNCHLDGRSDGESWLIHGERLQTPMLAGRIANTAPYKWDGGAKDLPTSLRATIDRLGGDGLSEKHITAIAAYLDVLPAVRAPTRDKLAVARGKELFSASCSECHDGPAYTDRARHKFGGHNFDTPSLLGIAASAPYFHDGSAPTLDALLRDHGGVHGMASDVTGAFSDAQRADLVAFLETL